MRLATVNVAVRTSPVFGVTLTATVPFPVPLAPEVIDSHDALVVADQVHSFIVATVNGPAAPPFDAIEAVVGFTEYEQNAGLKSWLIETVCPAITSVPVRDAPLLAATLKVTVPLPLPLLRPVNEIHDALLLADHSHPDGAVIDVESPLAAEAVTEIVRGETAETAQLGRAGAASWSIVTNCSAMTRDAVRALLVFAETVNVTAPDPVPAVPPLMAIHDASVRTLHAQAVGALIVIRLFPPEDGSASRVDDRSYVQEAAS